MPRKAAVPYTKEQLQQAINAVRNKSVSIRRAAKQFKVPLATLHDHAVGKYRNRKPKYGRGRALDDDSEAALVRYAVYMSDRGFPLTRAALRSLALGIVKERKIKAPFNMETGPSKKWIRNFLKRHTELSLRKPDDIDSDRSQLSQEEVDKYFDILEHVIQEHNLSDPSHIYNCDETGFSGKVPFHGKVIAKKGTKRVYQRRVKFTGHTTVLFAASAAGRVLPPFIIYEGSCPDNVDCPSDWAFSGTKSGFINSNLFYSWFEQVFIPNCGRDRPVLLTMDNHVSHLTPQVIELAIKERIELLCFPPHSTHVLQPLDKGYFNLLKESMGNIAVSLGYGGMRTVPKDIFPKILQYAISKIPQQSVRSSFMATGISPFKHLRLSGMGIPTSSSSEHATDAPSSEPSVCEHCGNKKENPLVLLGIIPKDLSSVLVQPPDSKSKPRRKSLCARLLTTTDLNKGDAAQGSGKNISENNVSADHDSPKPSTSRSTTNNARLTPFAPPAKVKPKNKSKNTSKSSKTMPDTSKSLVSEPVTSQMCVDSSSSENVLCQICMTDSDIYFWVGCDQCARWFHYECLPSNEQPVVDLSLVCPEVKWFCNECQLNQDPTEE